MEIILDGWQEEIINHDGNVLLCTGRQVGKTLTFAVKISKYLISHPTSQIVVVSLTEDQAKLIIIMSLDYLEKNHRKLIAKGKHKPTQGSITLLNKSRVIARPVGNTGDAVRGFTGDVLVIDEASRMPSLMWAAAKPILLTTAGQIWMCSTPAGKEGYFYEAYLNKSGRFKVWTKTSEEVINNRPGSDAWTEKQKDAAIQFLKDERADMSELQYRQEYCGEFLEDLRRFFPDELINKCCVLKRMPEQKYENCYMGVDIARMGGDSSAYEIVDASNPKKFMQVENQTEQFKRTTHTEERILELNKSWNLEKIGIDAGSGTLGVGIYDHLLNNLETRKKVVPMNNRAVSLDRYGKKLQRIFKEDLYDNLRSMMEHDEIFLLDDADIIQSLRNIQIELAKDEAWQATRVRIFGRDSHIAEGLVRAAWLAKKERHKKFSISYI